MSKKKIDAKNNFSTWLAERPIIKLIGATVAIIGGLIGIITFVTGVSSMPELLARWNGKYYDRFNNVAFDGQYDPSLWEQDGNPGALIEQRDGALVLQPVNVTEDSNIAIFPIKQMPIPFNQFRAFEAKMKMSGKVKGTGFIKTQLFTIRNDKNWWIECQLQILKPGIMSYFCNIETGIIDNTGSPIYTYETEKIPVKFDTWYLSRFEVDPEIGRIRFYLDYDMVGEYTQEGGLAFSSLYPQLGSWLEVSNNFVGFYDDISIERKP